MNIFLQAVILYIDEIFFNYEKINGCRGKKEKKVNYFCDWSFVSFFSSYHWYKNSIYFYMLKQYLHVYTNIKINLQYRLQIDTSVPLYNWTNIHVASLHQSANEFHASFAIKYALQCQRIVHHSIMQIYIYPIRRTFLEWSLFSRMEYRRKRIIV